MENQRFAADVNRKVIDALIFNVHDIGVLEFGDGNKAQNDAGVRIDKDFAVIRDGGLVIIEGGVGLEIPLCAAATRTFSRCRPKPR